MRHPEYLSPTSVKLFLENREDFYIRYLSDHKLPRDPQTQPMSVGSAFDAYVKSYLHEKLVGKDEKFNLTTLFEAQVEPQNREWAWYAGKHAFEEYKSLGALSDLMIELEQASTTPRFEIEIRGNIDGVVILGKPDVFFMNKSGYPVILDWKVNGYCGKSLTSPKPGYMRLRGDDKKSGHHKNAVPMIFQGMVINTASYLEDIDNDWAVQLAAYGWLCGADVGQEFIAAIDQLACGPNGSGNPKIRIAEHRLRISRTFQKQTFENFKLCQTVIETGHIFTDLSREDSDARCIALDVRAATLKRLYESNNPADQEFIRMLNS